MDWFSEHEKTPQRYANDYQPLSSEIMAGTSQASRRGDRGRASAVADEIRNNIHRNLFIFPMSEEFLLFCFVEHI